MSYDDKNWELLNKVKYVACFWSWFVLCRSRLYIKNSSITLITFVCSGSNGVLEPMVMH